MSCAVELTLGCDQGRRKHDQAKRSVSKKATTAWEIAENAVRKLVDGAMQSTASLEKHAICLCCSLFFFVFFFKKFFRVFSFHVACNGMAVKINVAGSMESATFLESI